jgi:FMN reductase
MACSDPKVVEQLTTVGQQAVGFALAFRPYRVSEVVTGIAAESRAAHVLALAN